MNMPWLVEQDVLLRHPDNPVITAADIPFTCNTVFNGSAVKLHGTYHILVRVEGQHGYSVFALGHGEDGYSFELESLPVMTPASEGFMQKYETAGVEVPRITVLEGDVYVTYTAFSGYGPVMALARTEDLTSFERLGVISEPGTKDGILFPRRINGSYARLDRPVGNDVGRIWISFSDELLHWGRSRVLVSPRPGYWDSYRVGGSTTPIETDEGWLEIYHGIKMTGAGPIYRAGVVVLDLENPTVVRGRSPIPVLAPRTDYERIGDINNVVYPSAAIQEADGELKVYYGAADTCICVATTTVEELLSVALEGAA